MNLKNIRPNKNLKINISSQQYSLLVLFLPSSPTGPQFIFLFIEIEYLQFLRILSYHFFLLFAYLFFFPPTALFSDLALPVPCLAVNLLISKAVCTILWLPLHSAANEAISGDLWMLRFDIYMLHSDTIWDLGSLYLEQNISCILTPKDKTFQFSYIDILSCVITFNLHDIFSWPLLLVLLVEIWYYTFLKTQKSSHFTFVCQILTRHEIIPQQSKLTSNTRDSCCIC